MFLFEGQSSPETSLPSAPVVSFRAALSDRGAQFGPGDRQLDHSHWSLMRNLKIILALEKKSTGNWQGWNGHEEGTCVRDKLDRMIGERPVESWTKPLSPLQSCGGGDLFRNIDSLFQKLLICSHSQPLPHLLQPPVLSRSRYPASYLIKWTQTQPGGELASGANKSDARPR